LEGVGVSRVAQIIEYRASGPHQPLQQALFQYYPVIFLIKIKEPAPRTIQKYMKRLRVSDLDSSTSSQF